MQKIALPIQSVIEMADRGLLSLDNIGALTRMADQDGRKLEFNPVVRSRRNGELVDTFHALNASAHKPAESAFVGGHRLIVAHDLRSTHGCHSTKAEGRCHVDFGVHLIVHRTNAQMLGQDRDLRRQSTARRTAACARRHRFASVL